MFKKKPIKKVLQFFLFLFVIPFVVFIGAVFFNDKQYAWVSLIIVILTFIPFFANFENGTKGSKQLVIIAIMVTLSVLGRIIFIALPGFKPVTAIIIITAMYFGCQAGFMTGALSAVISNFYFGQGPWTPFQMFIWGFIGLLAGLIGKLLKENRLILILYGLFSGIVFSLLMDIWTVLWWDGSFNFSRYFVSLLSSLGFTITYAISNTIFLLLLEKPIGVKLERIKTKYGIVNYD